MKAYQCSECKYLVDLDERCQCVFGIDPRPNHRQKGDANGCKENFEPLKKEEIWHKKFSWEK